jgi:iron complex transport system ATP-binding protein
MLHAASLGHTAGERWLYRALEWRCEPGGFSAVIGPNGSGKSTLLRQLVGIERPREGMVELGGKTPIGALAPRERARRIAYLPQSTTLYYDLPVRDVVMLGRAPYVGRFMAPAPEDERAVDEALSQVGVGALAARGYASLSGGEQRLVMLARLLATAAPCLVLDEPTTALDVGHALTFLELCRSLAASGRSIVMAMHDLELARRYADDVLLLSGAPDGAWRAGAARDVLSPEVLEPVFGVRIIAREDGMAFFPRLAGVPGPR